MKAAGSVLVDVRDLTVRFGRVTAIDALTGVVPQGVVGLLGPNGAGKSTLMSVLSMERRPDHGHVTVAGHDANNVRGRCAIRGRIGYLPQRFDLAPAMSVRDTVRYAAWCHGVPRRATVQTAERALATVELDHRAPHRVRRLSGGQRQRLGLAAAIAHDPQVLLLDEPTVGLDPEQRVKFRGYLRALPASTTVLLATHLVEDVARAADTLMVLSAGSIAFNGTVRELAEQVSDDQADLVESPLERGYRRVLTSAEDHRQQ